jgi:hypothetical protein
MGRPKKSGSKHSNDDVQVHYTNVKLSDIVWKRGKLFLENWAKQPGMVRTPGWTDLVNWMGMQHLPPHPDELVKTPVQSDDPQSQPLLDQQPTKKLVKSDGPKIVAAASGDR